MNRHALFSLSLGTETSFLFVPVKRFLFVYNKTPPSSFTSSFRNRAGPGFFPFFCILDPQTSSRRNSFGQGSMIPQFLSLFSLSLSSYFYIFSFPLIFFYIDSDIRFEINREI